VALVSFVNIDPSHSAYDSIGGDSPGLLEVLDRTLGLRPKEAVERSRIVC
jgi:hypothetical protein